MKKQKPQSAGEALDDEALDKIVGGAGPATGYSITSPRDPATGQASGIVSPRDAASGLPTGK